MSRTIGAMDLYDDGGETLRGKFDNGIPDFIKEAELLTDEERVDLPDHAFAVVLIDGARRMRKFACVDKAHTAVNAIYLLEHSRELPYEARSVAAQNIKTACQYFNLKVPARLAKMAARSRRLIDTDGSVPMMSKAKRAELTNSSTMPKSEGPIKRVKKIASRWVSPYVDIQNDVHPTVVGRDQSSYALNDDDGPQFPLDSYSQVKEAAEFFTQQARRFHPRRRHEACVKIAARANILGIELSDIVRKYGATDFAPDGHIKMGFETRRRMYREAGEDDSVSLLDSLMAKQASAQPEEFAEALAEVDIALGMSRYWDKSIPDPWLTTFGVRKQAEWSWSHGNEQLSASQLKALLKEGPGRGSLERSFGEELVSSMTSNPTQIFDSLPLDQKIVITRMAYQE